MSFNEERLAFGSGNYYTFGVKRVLAKLGEMGIPVPKDALAYPTHEGPGKINREFTKIEHAMLDWFEGRDYDLAQALIHYRQPSSGWQVIRLLDEKRCPSELSFDMLCPTLKDAVACIVWACDQDLLRVDGFRQIDEAIDVVIAGNAIARIEPIKLEPFNVEVRDRVRTAFKGARERHLSMLQSRAARLPGFEMFRDVDPQRDRVPSHSCLFFGFPANWAFAMRSALKQVGIDVKQNQAQELAAVFFGGSSWHQLVKHQHELDGATTPVAVVFQTPMGEVQRFYHSSEEAVFAIGGAMKQWQEPIALVDFDLTYDKRQVILRVMSRREHETARPEDLVLRPTAIKCGGNDYWSIQGNTDETYGDAALRILANLQQSKGATNTLGVLYRDEDVKGTLEAMLAREGLPSDQIVYLGGHAIAVSYVPDPNGLGKLAAAARVYKLVGNRVESVGSAEMYKAEVKVENADRGCTIEIRADYGQDAPIVVPFAEVNQVRRFLDLAYANNLFTLETPDIRVDELRLRPRAI